MREHWFFLFTVKNQIYKRLFWLEKSNNDIFATRFQNNLYTFCTFTEKKNRLGNVAFVYVLSDLRHYHKKTSKYFILHNWFFLEKRVKCTWKIASRFGNIKFLMQNNKGIRSLFLERNKSTWQCCFCILLSFCDIIIKKYQKCVKCTYLENW